MREARASGSPRAVSLIVFAMIRSMAATSIPDMPFSSSRRDHHGINATCIRPSASGDSPTVVNRLTYRSMNLDLTDDETAALARLLKSTIDADRYPLSPRIQTLKAILDKIRPEPVREPLPPLKHYEPPRATAGRRRRG